MSLPLVDPGILFALGFIVLVCLLGAAADRYGADTRASESTDRRPSGPLGHHS
jgi:hypothetical protein